MGLPRRRQIVFLIFELMGLEDFIDWSQLPRWGLRSAFLLPHNRLCLDDWCADQAGAVAVIIVAPR
jgi:hypothetical protein